MNKFSKISWAVVAFAAAAVSFASCNKEEDGLKLDGRYVNLKAFVGSGVDTKSGKSVQTKEFFTISEGDAKLFITATSAVNMENPFEASPMTKGAIKDQVYFDALTEFDMYMTKHIDGRDVEADDDHIGKVVKVSGAPYWSFTKNGEKILWPVNPDGTEDLDQVYSFVSIIGDDKGANPTMRFDGLKDQTVQYYGITSDGKNDAERMQDLLVAYTQKKHQHNSSEDLVELDFYHPLTAVRFHVTDNVTKITVQKAKKSGILKYGLNGATTWQDMPVDKLTDANGDGVVDADDNIVTYTQEISDALIHNDADGNPTQYREATFFLVPQDFSDSQIILTFEVKVKDAAGNFLHLRTISTRINNLGVVADANGKKGWKSGYIYNYYVDEDADGKVGIQIDEPEWNGQTKSSVLVTNTKRSTAYLRATAVANWCSKSGNIIETYPLGPENFNTTDWVKGDNDDYYYYKNSLNGFESTTSLIKPFTNPVNSSNPKYGLHLVMVITSQAIEADSKATFVSEAWGENTKVGGQSFKDFFNF